MTQNSEEEAGGAESAPPGLLARAWEQCGTLVLAVTLALCIRTCIAEPYRIPSGSMLPTLLVGDHLFVNRFVYGIRIPFTEWKLPGLREPERGEVVVFDVARGPGSHVAAADARPEWPRDRFVKRIVGLPGDHVEVRGTLLYINGEPVPLRDTGEQFDDDMGNELRVLRETLDGREHAILDDPAKGRVLEGEWRVPEDRYLMVGDNRDNSNDGRAWGTVRLVDFKGPAFMIYWSWNWDGAWIELANPLTWWRLLSDETRWDRIGAEIE